MTHFDDVIYDRSDQNRILQPKFSQIKPNKPAFHIKSKFSYFL